MIKINNINLIKNDLCQNKIRNTNSTRTRRQNVKMYLTYATNLPKLESEKEQKKTAFLFLKNALLIYNLIMNVICIITLFYINYMEKLRIYHDGTDVTTAASACMYVINLLLIWIILKKLSFKTMGWKIVITNTLLNIGNIFGGTYIYKLWEWCQNNYKEGIKLRYNYSIEYQWTVQDKMNCCHKIYEKYPQLLTSDKQKIERNIVNTKLDDIPNLIQTYNDKRLLIIQNMSKNIHHDANTSNVSNVSSIYEQIENIKQAIISLYTGSYWYIGWGISIGIGILLMLSIDKLQQPEFCKKSDLDKIVDEIEKLKRKMENPSTNEIQRYWASVKRDPEFLKKISAELYTTPCLARKNKGTSVITHESPFDYAQESNDLLIELLQLNERTAKEESELRTKLGTEVHDLAIKYNELEQLYKKIQPRVDQAEMKVNSRLINVAKEILEDIK